MKQVLQDLRSGKTVVADVPCPAVQTGQLLIRSSRTLVSAGTERMLVDFAKSGWIERARQQPDKVRMVLDKVGTDGLLPALDAVINKLDQPLAMGYCNVGVVLEVGRGVAGFAPGDRVASNGNHAEVVSVPANLCARVPDAVADDEAAFTVAGAVALQGIRLAAPTLGETVVVTGLGLIGLLAVQLLRGQGCRVLGIDMDPDRLDLARRFGADVVDLRSGADPVASARELTRGRGADAVIIATSTDSNEPVHQAAEMSRQRGRIVLVGVTGMTLSRADFFAKELTFQVSCSYGPGRYDSTYEQQGIDYPIGHVRWTEQRNFEAVLDMMADRRVDASPLVSHRFSIHETEHAYSLLSGPGKSLGILLTYPSVAEQPETLLRQDVVRTSSTESARQQVGQRKCTVGFIGAGNYATSSLIPAFKAANADLVIVTSNNGIRGAHAARKFGFAETSTDVERVISNPLINTAVIATRHDSHAALVVKALNGGKNVFVEKPLALTATELDSVEQAYKSAEAAGRPALLMVGFNRRFAPHVSRIKQLLAATTEPKNFLMTVNAGHVPAAHWVHDPHIGGGRILGEGCHFVDLLRHLAGAPIVGFAASAPVASGTVRDGSSFTLHFADGSLGTVVYWTNGNKSFPKERLEVFVGGRVLQLDNYRRLTGFGWPGFRAMRSWRQDKGQKDCAGAFVRAIESGQPSPIPFSELLEVSRITIELAETLR